MELNHKIHYLMMIPIMTRIWPITLLISFNQRLKRFVRCLLAIEAYNPEISSIQKLCQFTPMTESEVKTIIMAMKSKSCKTDPIPTHIFKQLLPSVIPTVTKIVNLWLSEGEFCHMWKVAVVRPLLKKNEWNQSNQITDQWVTWHLCPK